MKFFLALCIACFISSACSEKEWSEEFIKFGFKDGYETEIKYQNGGATTFKVALESKAYNEIVYPVSMEVFLNGKLCGSASAQSAINSVLFTLTCSSNLGPGVHVYKVQISNSNSFGNFTTEKDLDLNKISGSITYTIEKSK